MRFYIPVVPMGYVRMTRHGKWVKKDAQRYISYKDMLGYWMRKFCETPIDGPITVSLVFDIPIPKSWSKKKREEALGKPVVVKPDLDNLIKGVFDAANGIVWVDDNRVARIGPTYKVYSDTPGITIMVEVMKFGEESAG